MRRAVLAVVAIAALSAAAAALALPAGSGDHDARAPRGAAANRDQTRSVAVTRAQARLSIKQAVGQVLIATYAGDVPPTSLLSAIKAGQIGSVILMGDNTASSVTVTRNATRKLQAAARAGHNPGLLIMTDQEGGEVKRLPGPPAYAAAQMGSPQRAQAQGYATAKMLKRAGVNVDLAPVADVSRVDGFITQQHRTFGHTPARVAAAACAFAAGLRRGGVAYTLKHFPGLGDAVADTDQQPVTINESAADINADGAAYRRCGASPWALVMVSSAIYRHLTGKLPAVMSPVIYNKVMPSDRIQAVTISDSLQSGAIAPWSTPARRSLSAGVDMVMYPGLESYALVAFRDLTADVKDGTLSRSRITQAADAVLALKRTLKLTTAG